MSSAAMHLTISFEDLEETETLDDFLMKKWCFPTRQTIDHGWSM
jgi:hypothetical protein